MAIIPPKTSDFGITGYRKGEKNSMAKMFIENSEI